MSNKTVKPRMKTNMRCTYMMVSYVACNLKGVNSSCMALIPWPCIMDENVNPRNCTSMLIEQSAFYVLHFIISCYIQVKPRGTSREPTRITSIGRLGRCGVRWEFLRFLSCSSICAPRKFLSNRRIHRAHIAANGWLAPLSTWYMLRLWHTSGCRTGSTLPLVFVRVAPLPLLPLLLQEVILLWSCSWQEQPAP
jgi:hypothetical protein